MKLLARFLLPLCLLCATSASAEVFQWRDAEGNLHFGDKAPEGAAQVRIIAMPTATEPTAPPPVLPEAGVMPEGVRDQLLYLDKSRSERSRIVSVRLVQETRNSLIFELRYFLAQDVDGRVGLSIRPDMSAWSVTSARALPGLNDITLTVGLSSKAKVVERSSKLNLIMDHSRDGTYIGELFRREVAFEKTWRR